MVFSPIWHGKPPSLARKSPVNLANSCTSEECRAFLGGGSKNVSKLQAPNPHHSFKYPIQEISWSNPSTSLIFILYFVRMASNRYANSYNGNCRRVQKAHGFKMIGFDFGSTGHLSRFSLFTSNNRKTASISSGRSKPLVSSSCRPESDGYRIATGKIHRQSWSAFQEKVSDIYLEATWFNLFHPNWKVYTVFVKILRK